MKSYDVSVQMKATEYSVALIIHELGLGDKGNWESTGLKDIKPGYNFDLLQARNQGGCTGCVRTLPTGPKGPHFDTQYPS